VTVDGRMQSRISFVTGTDQYGAQPPSGFPWRFAVLTWFEVGADSAEPWPLVRLVSPKIAELVGATTIQAESWQYRRYWFIYKMRTHKKKIREAPLSEWLEKSDDELHERSDFPSRLRFERQGEVVLWMETEMWSLVGGPDPYHDSVTLSFFSKNDLNRELEELFRVAATMSGIRIDQIGSHQNPATYDGR
jgi:hypothetical protein